MPHPVSLLDMQGCTKRSVASLNRNTQQREMAHSLSLTNFQKFLAPSETPLATRKNRVQALHFRAAKE